MKSFYPKSFLTYAIIFIDTFNGSSWPKTCRATQAEKKKCSVTRALALARAGSEATL